MADSPARPDHKVVPPSGRRPWSAPKLLEYGHIGKLTQGNSGTNVEPSGGKRVTCL
jgi:hypothetical protein